MSSSTPQLHWKVAGRSGEGIDVAGIMFGKLCLRHGMNVFAYREYPSLIRGGHSTHQVHASFETRTCQQKQIDLLVAFNEEGISQHLKEIGSSSVVLGDATTDRYDLHAYDSTGAKFFDLPMTNLSREATGHFLAQNVVALGASCFILGLDLELLKGVITDQFRAKGDKVVSQNIHALTLGYEYALSHYPIIKTPFAKKPNSQLLMTGNHVIGMSAISAGVQFCSMYPMTPTSDILHFLADKQSKYPVVVKHVEDEIAAINQAIGASYAGVRSMTASATGGFALMVEATSLAGVMETPLVIVVGQRPGPATGLPTWSCQSDLSFILTAGHGEVPRVVFTPGSHQEHFDLTRLAFDLAEKYHLIVYILSDKFSLESYASFPQPVAEWTNTRSGFAADPLPEDDSYRRFVDTPEGWSPRSVPGQAHGLSITNSYEHDEFGYATEAAEMTVRMNKKRLRKLDAVASSLPAPVVLGPASADITLVCWGSTKMVIEQTLYESSLKNLGFTLNAIHIPCAWPFPTAEFSKMVSGAKKLVIVEGNQTGQMEALIRQQTGIIPDAHIRRFDGRPFYAEEILAELKKLI